jgi:hypothetical protein
VDTRALMCQACDESHYRYMRGGDRGFFKTLMYFAAGVILATIATTWTPVMGPVSIVFVFFGMPVGLWWHKRRRHRAFLRTMSTRGALPSGPVR